MVCCLLAACALTGTAVAAGGPADVRGAAEGVTAREMTEIPVTVPRLSVTMTPVKVVSEFDEVWGQSLATGGLRSCPQLLVTHSGLDFEGNMQSIILQGGFVEQEIAAASYTLSASAFPVTVNTMEMAFGQNYATEPTITHWSVLVWEGVPSDSNPPIVTYSSDDVILPHLTFPAGSSPQAVLLNVTVDPGDPEQILVQDDGSHKFSVGFRVDQHHQPASSDCCLGFLPQACCPAGDPIESPLCQWSAPGNNNAFPTTDADGADAPSQNWLRCRDGCGGLACPGGWHDNNYVGMSGDWNIRASYTPFTCPDVGACCFSDGSCDLRVDLASCTSAGGTFQGAGTTCEPNPCPIPPGGCCDPERVCTDEVQGENCQGPGYTFFADRQCSTIDCPFPGACCFFDTQECVQFTPSLCANAEGVYMGHGTTCGLVDCTEPFGACCDVAAICTDGVLESQCVGTYDTFFELQTCGEVSCPTARGACCGANDSCLQFQEQGFCTNVLGGIYAGDGTDCDDQVCVAGACCLIDGSCQEVVESECLGLGGTFQGVGSDCATAGCPQPHGACCVNENCVADQTEVNCIGFGGSWVGAFTDCGPPDPCITSATIVGVESCRDHGSAPPVERCLDVGAVNIEPRLGGVQKLVFQVSDPVTTVDASVECVNSTYTGAPSVTPDGTTVTVELSSAFPDLDCCTVTLSGQVDDSIAVRTLTGDVDLSGDISTADGSSVKQRLGLGAEVVGAQYDVDTDDAISTADKSSVKARLGNIAAVCP
ncbi:MAG TPA: hypothetical protein VM243_11395 [Phycisphaerae bacterium]|nr:hypothetical protein [Phycisphaerae bacterium]